MNKAVGGGVEQKKKKSKKSTKLLHDTDCWQDGVDATIRLIGWAKRGMRRDG
jgi:hypothetical protein